jgi:hypothetical protein
LTPKAPREKNTFSPAQSGHILHEYPLLSRVFRGKGKKPEGLLPFSWGDWEKTGRWDGGFKNNVEHTYEDIPCVFLDDTDMVEQHMGLTTTPQVKSL